MNMIRSFNPFVVRTQEPEDTRSKKLMSCIPVVGRFIASRAQISLYKKANKNYEIIQVTKDYNRSSLLRNICSIAFMITMLSTQVLGTHGKIVLSALYLVDFYCEIQSFAADYKRYMVWLDTQFPRSTPKSWYGPSAAGAE